MLRNTPLPEKEFALFILYRILQMEISGYTPAYERLLKQRRKNFNDLSQLTYAQVQY